MQQNAQNWNQPAVLWTNLQKKVIRKLQWQVIGFAALVVLFIAVQFVIFYTILRPPAGAGTLNVNIGLPSESLLILLVVCLFMLIPGVLIYRQFRREKRILKRVPAHHGLICPRCLGLVHEVDNRLQCGSCERSFDNEWLHQHWDQHPHQEQSPPIFKLIASVVDRDRVARWQQNLRNRPSVAVGWMLSCAVIGAIIFYLFTDELLKSLFLIPVMLFTSGFMLAQMGWKRNVGEELVCTVCGYLKGPHMTSRNCPECGSKWQQPGGFSRGQTQRSPKLVFLGISLIVLSLPFLFGGFNLEHNPAVLSVLPTKILMSQIVASGYDDEEWLELQSRNISLDEKRRLAEELLNARKHEDWLPTQSQKWLKTNLAVNGSANLPELTERYYDEMFLFQHAAPDDATVGRRIIPSWQFKVTGPTYLAIEGVYINGSPQKGGRKSTWQMASQHTRGAYRLAEPQVILSSRDPGTYHCRVVFFKAYGPKGLEGTKINWKEDSSPAMPGSIVWAKRVELEHTVEVQP